MLFYYRTLFSKHLYITMFVFCETVPIRYQVFYDLLDGTRRKLTLNAQLPNYSFQLMWTKYNVER